MFKAGDKVIIDNLKRYYGDPGVNDNMREIFKRSKRQIFTIQGESSNEEFCLVEVLHYWGAKWLKHATLFEED